jgi:ribonuclease HII
MDFNNKTTKQINDYLRSLEIDKIENYLEYIRNDSRISVKNLVNSYQKKIDNYRRELIRIRELSKYENELYDNGVELIAGVDEAGRGPLAGPVYAAAVVLPKGIIIEGINDSKKLTSQKRDTIYDIIIEKALYYSIAYVDADEIDNINISKASIKSMYKAVINLNKKPEHLLIDGNDVKQNMSIPYTCIVKGDSLSISIAAASILAKVSRDRFIEEYDKEYPEYGFAKHKGYGTKEHMEAIRKHGITPIHRKTFLKNI